MNAANGTISPPVLRAYQPSIASGCMRQGASPCTITGRNSVPKVKSFTSRPEKITDSIALISDRLRPKAPAFCWSMSSRSAA